MGDTALTRSSVFSMKMRPLPCTTRSTFAMTLRLMLISNSLPSSTMCIDSQYVRMSR